MEGLSRLRMSEQASQRRSCWTCSLNDECELASQVGGKCVQDTEPRRALLCVGNDEQFYGPRLSGTEGVGGHTSQDHWI